MTRGDPTPDFPEGALPEVLTLPSNGRILAVDPGKRRWGFALSDPSQTIVARFWTETLPLKVAAVRVAEIFANNDAVAVVLGLAVRQDGSEGELASIARRVGAYLEKKGIPRFYWDERLTTRLAESALFELSRSRASSKRRRTLPSSLRARTDGISAAVLLKYFLEYLRTMRGSSGLEAVF